jgi:hypothetical protein
MRAAFAGPGFETSGDVAPNACMLFIVSLQRIGGGGQAHFAGLLRVC